MESKKRYRIVNVTNLTGGRGNFLDLGEISSGVFIPPGKSVTVELSYIPQILRDWAEAGNVRIHNDTTGQIEMGPSADISRSMVAPVGEVSATELDIGEDEPDLAEAVPAALPHQADTRSNGAHLPDNSQQSRAKVTLGSQDESYPVDAISPIPGDRPRSIDDSEKFTVKAPRTQGVGGIMGR